MFFVEPRNSIEPPSRLINTNVRLCTCACVGDFLMRNSIKSIDVFWSRGRWSTVAVEAARSSANVAVRVLSGRCRAAAAAAVASSLFVADRSVVFTN